MDLSGRRLSIVGAGAFLVFLAVSGILLQIMPGPRRPNDYFIIGAVATIAALGTFLAAILLGSKTPPQTTRPPKE